MSFGLARMEFYANANSTDPRRSARLEPALADLTAAAKAIAYASKRDGLG